MIKNLFLIYSLHQYHQVNRLFEKLKLNKDSVLIIELFQRQNFSDELENFNDDNLDILRLNNWRLKEVITGSVDARKFIRKMKELAGSCDEIHLFVSQYMTDASILAYNILQPTTFYLMDEGTSNFLNCDIRNEQPLRPFRLRIKSLLYKLRLTTPREVIYFTKYDLKPTKLSDSVLKYEETKRSNAVDGFNSDEIIYLGTSLVELGLISKISYLDYLKKVKEFYSEFNVLYVPHRRENPQLIKEIEKLGIEIKKLDCPFENWFQKQKIIPAEISSHYYATVLGNLCDRYSVLPVIRGFISKSFDQHKRKYSYVDKIHYHNLTYENIKFSTL